MYETINRIRIQIKVTNKQNKGHARSSKGERSGASTGKMLLSIQFNFIQNYKNKEYNKIPSKYRFYDFSSIHISKI